MTKSINKSQIERLHQLLAIARLKKADLARIADVSPQAVTNWFKYGLIGKPAAAKISAATGVSLDWLLNGTVEDDLHTHKIRRQRLKQWFDTHPLPARQQEWQLMQDLINNPERSFSAALARRIEFDYQIPSMFLDSVTDDTTVDMRLTEQERELLSYFQRFPDSARSEMLSLFREKAEDFDRLFDELLRARRM